MTRPFADRAAASWLAAALVLAALPATGASWNEAGDAVQLLPGQSTLGTGSLDMILGRFATAQDVDLYRIQITDPAAFSAEVEAFGGSCTQIFLFDENGLGIAADDDNPLGGFNAILPVGNALYAGRAPGTYLLAVSLLDVDPLSAGGLIFPNELGIVGPTGPGGGQPLSSWFDLNAFEIPANYTIFLTGATFVPEPAHALGLAAGLASALALARRARRRAGS